MQFYHYATVDVHYKIHIDNLIYVLVHNNYWWHWILHENATSVLDYFR